MEQVSERLQVVRYAVRDREDRPWSNLSVFDNGASFITKRAEVHPGHRLSLQYHDHRSEHWVIVACLGDATVDDLTVQPGNYIAIPCGAAHRVHNTGDGPWSLIEVHCGAPLDEHDI